MSNVVCLEASPNAKEFEFDHTVSTCKLPQGPYKATKCPAQHILGSNGAGILWVFVEITDAPDGAEDWIGRQINIRLRATGAEPIDAIGR